MPPTKGWSRLAWWVLDETRGGSSGSGSSEVGGRLHRVHILMRTHRSLIGHTRCCASATAARAASSGTKSTGRRARAMQETMIMGAEVLVAAELRS